MLKTIALMEHRQTKEPVTVEIISKEPLRPYQLREAITHQLGDRWQYRVLSLSCHDV